MNVNLIHRLLILEFAVAPRAFDAMFRIIVLSACQWANIERKIGYEPGPSPSESRIRGRTQGTLSSDGLHRSAEGLCQYLLKKLTK